MTPKECPSGAALQITFEFEGSPLFSEPKVANEVPRSIASGVRRFPGVVLDHPRFEVSGLPNVVMTAFVCALDQVNVVHRGWMRRPAKLPPPINLNPQISPSSLPAQTAFQGQCPPPPGLRRAAFAAGFVRWPASRRLGEGWCPGGGLEPRSLRNAKSRNNADLVDS